jgi:RND family efflux transporter MFP subunit
MGDPVRLLFILPVAASIACSPDATPEGSAAAAPPAGDGMPTSAATPVHIAAVRRGDLAVVVSGPGRTEALDVQKVRAPFTGTLASLLVAIGDRVGDGQVIGGMVAQASQAALIGAESMMRAATTPDQRSDAERALALAKQNLIQASLRAPRAGVIVSRGASEGDLVSQGDSIVSIASAESIVFIARIAQGDLPGVRPGRRAIVEVPGRAAPLAGSVHGLLQSDTSAMSVSVRIDLHMPGAPIPIGLFGTAHVTVGERHGVPVVPASAVLRDDVTGVSRVAIVGPSGQAHWLEVSPGVQQGDTVEITSPPLSPGDRVIVSGQVGLPDGGRVREIADTATPPGVSP